MLIEAASGPRGGIVRQRDNVGATRNMSLSVMRLAQWTISAFQ